GDVAALRVALSNRVRDGELTGFLEIGPEVLQPAPGAAAPEPFALRYQTNRPSYQDFLKWAGATVNAAVLAKRADAKGLALADVGAVTRPVPVVSKGLSERDAHSGEIRE